MKKKKIPKRYEENFVCVDAKKKISKFCVHSLFKTIIPLAEKKQKQKNKEHKMLHRMADKVYILYWKGEGQDHMF